MIKNIWTQLNLWYYRVILKSGIFLILFFKWALMGGGERYFIKFRIKIWILWFFMIWIGFQTDLAEGNWPASEETAWCKPSRWEWQRGADEAGWSKMIQDLEYHAKENEDEARLNRIITSSNPCLEITLMSWITQVRRNQRWEE